MSSLIKKLPILLLFFCTSAHTWAHKAPELCYTEQTASKKVSGPSPYFSGIQSGSWNGFYGAPNKMKLKRGDSRTSKQHFCWNIPILPYLTFSIGAGLAQEAYAFVQPCILQRSETGTEVVVRHLRGRARLEISMKDSLDSDQAQLPSCKVFIDLKKAKDTVATSLSVHYIELLFPEFRINTNRNAPEAGFWASLGGIIGMRWGRATQYVNYKQHGEDVQTTRSESFHLRDYRLGFTARVGWNGISIFYTQALTDLFKESMGPNGIRSWSIGVSISIT